MINIDDELFLGGLIKLLTYSGLGLFSTWHDSSWMILEEDLKKGHGGNAFRRIQYRNMDGGIKTWFHWSIGFMDNEVCRQYF